MLKKQHTPINTFHRLCATLASLGWLLTAALTGTASADDADIQHSFLGLGKALAHAVRLKLAITSVFDHLDAFLQ